MIPLLFHFHFRGVWRDIYTLSLRSCLFHTKTTQIIVHYDVSGDGSDWEEARSLPDITWRQIAFPKTLNGHILTDKIAVEIYKLEVLAKEGGFFSSLDFIFLNNFEPLRHVPAIIGTHCKSKKKLSSALMGAEPGSLFVLRLLEEYQKWTPTDSYERYSMILPWEIAGPAHPVEIIPRPVFYPWCSSNKKFLSGGKIVTKHAVALYLWRDDITVASLKETVIGKRIEEILFSIRKTLVKFYPGKILDFA